MSVFHEPLGEFSIFTLSSFRHMSLDTILYRALSRYSTRHFCHDLELHGGDLISSPVDSIVSLVLPKKSYGPNSVGKNYFSATPFSLLAKIATGGHNA